MSFIALMRAIALARFLNNDLHDSDEGYFSGLVSQFCHVTHVEDGKKGRI
jgi:hypothetical protein